MSSAPGSGAACCAAARLLAAVLATASAGLADGGIWIRQEAVAATAGTADQRAILVYEPETRTETMVVSTCYQGQLRDFAWIIPVPGQPDPAAIETLKATRDPFEELYGMTEPRAVVTVSSGGGSSCGGGGGGGSASTSYGATSNLRITERLDIDDLYIAVIQASVADELIVWLQQNGYGLTSTTRELVTFYVDRGWSFVAVKVDPKPLTSGDATGRRPTWSSEPTTGYFPESPLRIRFETDRIVFPMRVSQASTAQEGAEVLIYVIAPYRVTTANYPSATVQLPGGSFASSSQFGFAYQTAFDQAMDSGSKRGFVVESAEPMAASGDYLIGQSAYSYDLTSLGLSSRRYWFVTRLRSRLRPGDMTDDVYFTAADSNQTYEVYVAQASRGSGGWPFLAGGLAGGLHLRRRRRAGTPAPREAMVLGLIVAVVTGGW